SPSSVVGSLCPFTVVRGIAPRVVGGSAPVVFGPAIPRCIPAIAIVPRIGTPTVGTLRRPVIPALVIRPSSIARIETTARRATETTPPMLSLCLGRFRHHQQGCGGQHRSNK